MCPPAPGPTVAPGRRGSAPAPTGADGSRPPRPISAVDPPTSTADHPRPPSRRIRPGSNGFRRARFRPPRRINDESQDRSGNPQPVNHRQGGGGQHGRHHGRVVRLLPLRSGRRAGVPQGLLPRQRPRGRGAAGAGHLRHRVHRPPDRRPGVRPLRRHPRPQEAAGDQPADDGHGDLPDRPAAGLRHDRRGRADHPDRAAAGPGIRPGRRVGRRRADRLRVRRPGATRLLGQLAAGRGAAGPAAGQRAARAAGAGADRGGIPVLGLADPVPAVRGAGADRPVHPAVHRGVAGLPAGPAQAQAAAATARRPA